MKKIFGFIFTIVVSFLVIPNVSAASMSISANKTTVSPGSTVTVTVSLSGAAGSISLSSSNGNVLSGGGSDFLDNGSKSFTFKANSVGTARITASTVDVTGYDDKELKSSKSVTINVTNSSSSNTTSSKSSENTLKSLEIDGYELTPKFDKNVTDYSLVITKAVETIDIKASTSDTKATITGTGKKDLIEGDNKFQVVVIAENGNTKIYTLNVTVDSKPIVVKIGGEKYTLIKRKSELPELAIEHEDTSLVIEDQEIVAYRIDKLNYILVGLKNSQGNVKLYKFDSFKDSSKPFEYSPFYMFTDGNKHIVYLDFPKKQVPRHYKKYNEKVADDKVDVYKLSKKSNYSLLYGINVETGKKHVYKYDAEEKTFQIYDREEAVLLENQIDKIKLLAIGLIAFSAILVIVIIILIVTRKRKLKKIVNHYKKRVT